MLFRLSSAADQTPQKMCLTCSFLYIIKPPAAAATACLPAHNPCESSIFSKISDLLRESTGQTPLRDEHFVPARFCFQSRRGTCRDRAGVLISSELPGVIRPYCMCPDPETGCIPMPPRRLALKTQAIVPTGACARTPFPPGGLWVDEFTLAARSSAV